MGNHARGVERVKKYKVQMEQDGAGFHSRVGTQRVHRTHDYDAPTLVKDHVQGPPPSEDHKAWASAAGIYWSVTKSSRRLPAGIYRTNTHEHYGPCFVRQTNDTDTLVAFPDSPTQAAIDEVEAFLQLRERFRKHGLLFKRGMMFWGPAGSGKTSTVQLIIKLLIERYNVVVVVVENPSTAAACLHRLRMMEPERLVLAVMEDVEVICQRDEHGLLSLMDGEMQVDGIIYLATTNYPELLDPRLVDRPSRIDSIRYIGMPTASDRRTYFKAKLPDSKPSEIESYVTHSEGYSVAYMRELIILTKGFDNSLEAAAKMLDERRAESSKLSSKGRPDGPQGAGFQGDTGLKLEERRVVRVVSPRSRRPARGVVETR